MYEELEAILDKGFKNTKESRYIKLQKLIADEIEASGENIDIKKILSIINDSYSESKDYIYKLGALRTDNCKYITRFYIQPMFAKGGTYI